MEMGTASEPFATLRAAQGKGDQGPMAQSESCIQTDCLNRRVTSLGEEALCFDHFCSRCYELLEQAERGSIYPSQDAARPVEMAHRLDECARRALEISLSQSELSNLDRARLLDIVLWAGDMTSVFKRKRGLDSKGTSEDRRPEVVHDTMGTGRIN
jgi:hypothetical protein